MLIGVHQYESRKGLQSQLFWFIAWTIVTGFGIYLKPSAAGHGTHQQLHLPPCPSVLYCDRPCPGCGLTTSWTATIHAQFSEAFHAHPLGPVLYLGFTVSALIGIYGYIKKIRFDTNTKEFNWILGSFMMLFFFFGVIRFAITPLNDPHFLFRWKEPKPSVSKKGGDAASVPKTDLSAKLPVSGQVEKR